MPGDVETICVSPLEPLFYKAFACLQIVSKVSPTIWHLGDKGKRPIMADGGEYPPLERSAQKEPRAAAPHGATKNGPCGPSKVSLGGGVTRRCGVP
jgi:hypothetical protein